MEVMFVYYEDWVKLYVKGVCVAEGHDISGPQALTHLGHTVIQRSATPEEIKELIGKEFGK